MYTHYYIPLILLRAPSNCLMFAVQHGRLSCQRGDCDPLTTEAQCNEGDSQGNIIIIIIIITIIIILRPQPPPLVCAGVGQHVWEYLTF